jgi:hypothetical protein
MTILEQWQRLIFPPDTNDLRGGERLVDDRKTYAVDLARTSGRQSARVTRHHDC